MQFASTLTQKRTPSTNSSRFVVSPNFSRGRFADGLIFLSELDTDLLRMLKERTTQRGHSVLRYSSSAFLSCSLKFVPYSWPHLLFPELMSLQSVTDSESL